MKKIFSKSGILFVLVMIVWCIWFFGLFSKYREVHRQNEDILMLDILFVIATVLLFLAVQMIVKKQIGIRYQKTDNIATIEKIFISLTLYITCSIVNWVLKSFEFLQGIPSNQERLNERSLEDGLWQTLLGSSVNTPILEEIIFRGIFFVALYIILISIIYKEKRRIWTWILKVSFIISTSVFFSYLHVNTKEDFHFIIRYLPLAITLAIVYLITKNILYPMMLHALNNFQANLNFFIGRDMVHDSLMWTYIVITVFVILLLPVYIYYLKKHDLYKQLIEKVKKNLLKE